MFCRDDNLATSAEQTTLIEQAWSTQLLVSAGPGAGKTFSVVERLRFLCEHEHLNPGTEILVLSFSVAAVSEIRARLQALVEEEGADHELLFANLRTFDSFATQFLLLFRELEALDGKGYDDRIQMAIDLFAEDEGAKQELSRYRHVIVDEVQDLVGVRAQLTQGILRHAAGGFTILGDPAQAIYEYLVAQEEGALGSLAFLQWVKGHFQPTILELTENFRVGGNVALAEVAGQGRRLLLEGTDQATVFLVDFFCGLREVGSIAQPLLPAELQTGATCVLCRTNGQVLRLARSLRDGQIPFTIRKRKGDGLIPAWVGGALCRHTGDSISHEAFATGYQSFSEGRARTQSEDEAWEWLCARLGYPRKRNSLGMKEVRGAAFEGALAEDALPGAAESDAGVILSTIHRSKGREFDSVIVVWDAQRTAVRATDASDEARVLFVALTRAREALYCMRMTGASGLRFVSSERWGKSFGRRLSEVQVGIEGDIDAASFVSSALIGDLEDIADNQSMLAKEIHAGAPVRLELHGRAHGVPIYAIKALGRRVPVTIGATSEAFGRDLRKCIRSANGQSSLPRLIQDLWVEGVVTEVGDLGDVCVPREYRHSGLWLGVRLTGLGKCMEWGA